MLEELSEGGQAARIWAHDVGYTSEEPGLGSRAGGLDLSSRCSCQEGGKANCPVGGRPCLLRQHDSARPGIARNQVEIDKIRT